MEDWTGADGADAIDDASRWAPSLGGPGSGRRGPWAFDGESPVVAAVGMGVDSTAMVVEILESGGRIDVCLFADTGSEKPETYAYVPILRAYLARFGVPLVIVTYKVKNYRHWPKYGSLETNCLTNATLPSISFGGPGKGACSSKWKQAPQNNWVKAWKPAQRCWGKGLAVVKLIGFDASPRDGQRYSHSLKVQDPLYDYVYPLRTLGWDREGCAARIRAAGLPVPPKSACFFCLASKPQEVAELPKPLLRRIVLMEAHAASRLTVVEGLWRKSVKGCRGATPKPGSMTQFIRERMLLPADEIDKIVALAPRDLIAFMKGAEGTPIDERGSIAGWMEAFEKISGLGLSVEGMPDLYAETPA